MSEEKKIWRVYKNGEYPKKKKLFFNCEFPTRKSARHFCRNLRQRDPSEHLVIVHPNGSEEVFKFGCLT